MPKPDRRTARTHAALMSAFIGALLEDGYEALTVERVAERANVGRSTFYMHFTGKEDILRQCMARPSSVLSALVGNELPPGALVKQLEHFHEQRRRNRVFFAGPVYTLWINCLAGMIEPRLAKLCRSHRARPLMPLPLAALQIASGQLVLIANWLTVRPTTKAEPIADALTATSRANVAALLGMRHDAALVIPGEKLSFREAGAGR